MSKVSIIIPVWNLWHMTLACLESIAKHIPQNLIEVIVVNNGSSDETKQALEPSLNRLFANNFKIINFDENKGFSKACNAGANVASCPFLFFLNNDTILTNNCLNLLLKCFDNNSRLGMVSPLLIYPNGLIQHRGVVFNGPFKHLQNIYEFFPQNYAKAYADIPLQALIGAAILIPAQLFKDAGSFCEEYLNGAEDTELCLKLKEKNYAVICDTNSVIIHHTSQSVRLNNHSTLNNKIFNKRNINTFVPDIHNILNNAGLNIKVSSELTFHACLFDEQENELNNKFSKNFDLDLCLEQLKNEPIWYGGYNLITNYYKQNNKWQELTALTITRAKFFPFQEVFQILEQCAIKLNNNNLLSSTKNILNQIQSKLNQKNKFYEKVRLSIIESRKNNDIIMEKLCKQWIKENM